MNAKRRQRTRAIAASHGCEVNVVEREDAAGHWFPLSYMVRLPDGQWLEGLESPAAVEEAIRAFKAKAHVRQLQQMDIEEAFEMDDDGASDKGPRP